MRKSLQDVVAEAVKFFSEHGFTNEYDYNEWSARIQQALDETLRHTRFSDQMLRDHLEAVFNRLVGQGQVARSLGVEKFQVQKVAPYLRAELTRRIIASADLIKLNRLKMRAATLQRFQGWATSVPAGGAADPQRAKVKAEICKPLRQLPFVERRVLIDQGHKLNASISAVIAKDAGAIAFRWQSHWRQAGYNYREDHKERDGRIWLAQGSWAAEKGFVKPGPNGWSDSITQPAEEPFCRCAWVALYALRQLPEDMLTKAGKEALEKSKIEAAA